MTDPTASGHLASGPGSAVDTSGRRDPTADLVRVGLVHAALVAVPVFLVLVLVHPLVAIVFAIASAAAVTVWRCRGIDARTARALGATPLEAGAEPRLVSLAESVSMAVGVVPPRLHRIEDDGLNAVVWASGTASSNVAITTGLLAAADRLALEAVLARLLVDVRDGVVEGPTVATSLFGGVARGVLAGPVASLSRSSVDERRVALGDIEAASAIQYPPGMIAAIDLLRGAGETATVVARSPHGLEALWLAAPMRSVDGDPFAVHPPLADRADVLREL